MTEKKKI